MDTSVTVETTTTANTANTGTHPQTQTHASLDEQIKVCVTDSSLGCCSLCARLVHVCRIDHQCPRGWWGSPTCGPCDCDTDKGFDPNCNKTSGHCHCKVSWKHTNTRCHSSLLTAEDATLVVVSFLLRTSYTGIVLALHGCAGCLYTMCTNMTANCE